MASDAVHPAHADPFTSSRDHSSPWVPNIMSHYSRAPTPSTTRTARAPLGPTVTLPAALRLHSRPGPSMPIVNVPELHQSRPPRPRARQWHHCQTLLGRGGAAGTHLSEHVAGPLSSRLRGKHLAVFASASPSSEGTQRDEPAGGAGSTPTHPAALRSGMRMGFNSPEQLHSTYTNSRPSGRGHKFD